MSLKFRTEYIAEKILPALPVGKPLVFIGSCFSENISSRLRQCLWPSPNPCGTLFNPASIESALRLILFSSDSENSFRDTLRTDPSGIVHSMMFGSFLSARSEEEVLNRFRAVSEELHNSLKDAGALVVTFGTAWVYRMHDGDIAGNCHKFPASDFIRERLTIESIAQNWNALISDLRKVFPDLRIIFTVSPVRHLKDGFEGNSVSKATLILAVEKICDSNPGCHYFPAYEILNDDLRDYRFYATDLVHPSEQGVEYIFEKFVETFFDNKGKTALRKGQKLYRSGQHRPLISE